MTAHKPGQVVGPFDSPPKPIGQLVYNRGLAVGVWMADGIEAAGGHDALHGALIYARTPALERGDEFARLRNLHRLCLRKGVSWSLRFHESTGLWSVLIASAAKAENQVGEEFTKPAHAIDDACEFVARLNPAADRTATPAETDISGAEAEPVGSGWAPHPDYPLPWTVDACWPWRAMAANDREAIFINHGASRMGVSIRICASIVAAVNERSALREAAREAIEALEEPYDCETRDNALALLRAALAKATGAAS